MGIGLEGEVITGRKHAASLLGNQLVPRFLRLLHRLW